jgi:hypothetical protein
VYLYIKMTSPGNGNDLLMAGLPPGNCGARIVRLKLTNEQVKQLDRRVDCERGDKKYYEQMEPMCIQED